MYIITLLKTQVDSVVYSILHFFNNFYLVMILLNSIRNYKFTTLQNKELSENKYICRERKKENYHKQN